MAINLISPADGDLLHGRCHDCGHSIPKRLVEGFSEARPSVLLVDARKNTAASMTMPIGAPSRNLLEIRAYSDLQITNGARMGEVLPFKRRSSTSMADVERVLFIAINRSSFIRKSGVSAVRGDPSGVMIVRDRSWLGTWYHWTDRFFFMPALASGVGARVGSVGAAFDATVDMCQRLRAEKL